MNFVIFGMCFAVCGAAILGQHMWYEWTHSKQKAQEEFLKFWNHLEDKGIDPNAIIETTRMMKHISDYKNANKRLSKPKKHADAPKI